MSTGEQRRSSIGGGGSDSATRLTRVEERETLHNLNSRLQYFLTRMKELETRNNELQARVDTGASSSKTQTEQMRATYEKELSELRRSQDKDVELIAELKARAAANAAKAVESDKVAAAHKKKAERCDELEGKFRLVSDERERLAGALKAEEERAEKASQAAAVAEAKAGLLEKKLAPLREQLATAEELRRKEGATFRETIDELTGANRGELGRMQAAYDAQLKDALDAAKTRADEERAAEVEQLAAHFQAVEAELSREVGEEREAKQAAQKRATELAASHDELLKRVNSAERRVAELDRELAEKARVLDATVSSLQAQLETARTARKDKEAEFNELMDVKISLDEELKTYRCLLEREEERLGITPVQDRTKRRRTALSGPVPYVCTLDMTNDCVSVRNAGDEPAALGGYSLKSDSAVEPPFVFPADFELQPGATVTVWSGKKNQRRRRDPLTELWWSARYIWDGEQGGVATLVDASGADVSMLTAAARSVAEAPNPMDAVDTEGEGGAASSGGNCAIM